MARADLGGLSLVILAAAGCTRSLGPIAPVTLPAISAVVVQRWIEEVAPRRGVRYDLRWELANKQGHTAGRAVARIATPDSLRFDYRAPFGRSGAAVVIGDSAVWVRPQADKNTMVPAAPLFWLALGAPQVPPADAELFGREDANKRVWRVVRGRESMDVVLDRGPAPRLRAQWRRDGTLIGMCELSLTDRGLPASAVLTFPETSSRFAFSVESADTLAVHDPTIWSPPR
jgi:hypothetical protein